MNTLSSVSKKSGAKHNWLIPTRSDSKTLIPILPTRNQITSTALDISQGTEAIVFQFENPVWDYQLARREATAWHCVEAGKWVHIGSLGNNYLVQAVL